jgi:hypothetical protein
VRGDFSGITAQPSDVTYNLFGANQLSNITKGAPGGDTIKYGSPGYLNGQGVARAGGYVSSAGVLSLSFGITSATKMATGVYTVNVSTGFNFAVATIYGNATTAYSITVGNSGSVITVRTFNNTGAAADVAFEIAIF